MLLVLNAWSKNIIVMTLNGTFCINFFNVVFFSSFSPFSPFSSPSHLPSIHILHRYSIMFMPIVLAFIFLLAHTCLLLKKRCIDGRKKDLNKHAHAMVSMNLVVMYLGPSSQKYLWCLTILICQKNNHKYYQ